jgi:hypothetical protein
MTEQPSDPQDPREARELWTEVGQRFGELGRAVRSHLDLDSPDSATWSPPTTDEPAGPPRGDQWSESRETVRRLGRNAQRLTAQAGEAARDPVVRETAQEAARTLGAAVSRTAEELAAQLRDNTRSPRWSDPDRPRPTSPPPVAPVRPEGEGDPRP